MITEYNVSSVIVDALINDDTSALQDHEHVALQEFTASADELGVGYWCYADDVHPEIYQKCDVLGAVCADLYAIQHVAD